MPREAARLAGVPRHRAAPPRLGAGRRATAGRWSTTPPRPSRRSADTPRKVFLALGRQETRAPSRPRRSTPISSAASIRSSRRSPCRDATYILARGPFSEADDRALLEAHGIDAIVAKNSGGAATYGKIAAARTLGIEVILIRRPALPDMPSGASVEEVLRLVDHALTPAEKRGV